MDAAESERALKERKSSRLRELGIESFSDLVRVLKLTALDLDVLESEYEFDVEQIYAVVRFWEVGDTCLLWGLTGSGKTLVALLIVSISLSRGGVAGILTTGVVLSDQIYKVAMGHGDKKGVLRLPAEKVIYFTGGRAQKRRKRFAEPFSLVIGTKEAAANDAREDAFPLHSFDCLVCDEFHNLCEREGYARLVGQETEDREHYPAFQKDMKRPHARRGIKLLMSATPRPSPVQLDKLIELLDVKEVLTLAGRRPEINEDIVQLHLAPRMREWINVFYDAAMPMFEELRLALWRAQRSRRGKRPEKPTEPPTGDQVREIGERIDRLISKNKLNEREKKLLLYHLAHVTHFIGCAERLVNYHPVVFLDYFARGYARVMYEPRLEEVSKSAVRVFTSQKFLSVFREAAELTLYGAILDYSYWHSLVGDVCPEVDRDGHTADELREIFLTECWKSCLADYPFSNPKDDQLLRDLLPAVQQPGYSTFVYTDSVLDARLCVDRVAYNYRFSGFRIAAVCGDTPEQETLEIVERFKRGEIQVLVSTTLREGIDVGVASQVINRTLPRSAREERQRRGRLRKGGLVRSYVVVDSYDARKRGRVRSIMSGMDRLFASYAQGQQEG